MHTHGQHHTFVLSLLALGLALSAGVGCDGSRKGNGTARGLAEAAGTSGGMDAGPAAGSVAVLIEADGGGDGDGGALVDLDAGGELETDAGAEPPTPAADAAVLPPPTLDLRSVATLTDGELAAVMTAINLAEVHQGRLASTRAAAQSVIDHAAKMVSDHNAANGELARLVANESIRRTASDLSHAVIADSNATRRTLTSLRSTQFDSAYVAARIAADANAIAFLDLAVPVTRSIGLRALFETARETAEAELVAVQAIPVE